MRASFTQDGFQREVSGRLAGHIVAWHPSLLCAPHMCSLGDLLDPENEKYVASLPLFKQGPAPPFCLTVTLKCQKEMKPSCSGA